MPISQRVKGHLHLQSRNLNGCHYTCLQIKRCYFHIQHNWIDKLILKFGFIPHLIMLWFVHLDSVHIWLLLRNAIMYSTLGLNQTLSSNITFALFYLAH